MATLRLVPSPRVPPLFARLRFDPDLEAQALRQLAGLDVAECRATYGRLVDQLDLQAPGVSPQEVAALLLDTLQRVNRRLHRPPEGETACRENRAQLISTFASLDDAERARQEFLPALGRLLIILQSPATSHPLIEKAQNFIEENY